MGLIIIADNNPISAPANTSVIKCCERYILEYPPNMAIIKQSNFIYLFFMITAKTKKVANAVVVCPEGKLREWCKSTPLTTGNSIPNSLNITDGRGICITLLITKVIKLESPCDNPRKIKFL